MSALVFTGLHIGWRELSKSRYAKQKVALSKLDNLFENAGNILVIHYSCESVYDPLPGGASPRITSVAVRWLESGQTNSFSIHQVAERNAQGLQNIDSQYDHFERQMLDEFFRFVDQHQTQRWLHWNMRDINYGFAALEHRFRVLGGQPVVVHDDHKHDLARMLVDIYGVGYIGHPRLEKLLEKNNIGRQHFLTGAEEAKAFVEKNYVGLHQSTLRKVDIVANIAGRAHDRTLKTNATWWDVHGGSLKGAFEYLADHPIFTFIAGIASVTGLLYAWLHHQS